MSNFKGFVAKISTKTGRGSRGPWTLYSVKMEDENGQEIEQWFSNKFSAPDFKEGDYISLESEQNDKGYWDITGFKPLKNAPAKAAKAGKSGVDSTRPSTASHIHYQNSRTAAIQAVEMLFEHDALPLSSAKTGAGVAKRYKEIMALIDKLTVRFFHDVETLRIIENVADEGADAAVSVGKLPEDDEDDEVDEDSAAD